MNKNCKAKIEVSIYYMVAAFLFHVWLVSNIIYFNSKKFFIMEQNWIVEKWPSSKLICYSYIVNGAILQNFFSCKSVKKLLGKKPIWFWMLHERVSSTPVNFPLTLVNLRKWAWGENETKWVYLLQNCNPSADWNQNCIL